MWVRLNKTLGGVLLIVGTCVGAGMLALPVTSAASGFKCALLALAICWGLSYYSGLLSLEVTLWFKGEPSYISMARHTLGRTGEVCAWILFLLLFYSLLAAYIAGGGALLTQGMRHVFHREFPSWMGALPWVLFFGAVIWAGAQLIDLINRVFVVCLVSAFIALVFASLPAVDWNLLVGGGDARYLWAALPVLMTSFGFHIVIPSIHNYLGNDIPHLRRVIFYGSVSTLSIYVIWEGVVFGLIPISGSQGLIHILEHGDAVTGLIDAMQPFIHTTTIQWATKFFAFFALASSFLGVSFGLFDLLRDGFHWTGKRGRRLWVACATFLPPLIYAYLYPEGFVVALGYAGALVALLHGILPVLMVYVGRKQRHATDTLYRTPGGVGLMVLATVFFLAVIGADIAVNLGWLDRFPR